MDVYRAVLYLEFVFLSMLIWVKATTITVDADHCGGDISLDVNVSLSLNYYGTDLNEDASDKYPLSEKKCTFKISASRSNYEICIRNKDHGRFSVYQIRKCFLAFKYYLGPYELYYGNSKDCAHFGGYPLCTTYDTVYAVYKYNSYVSYTGVRLEFEFYLRIPPAKHEEQDDTWPSSWSESDTSKGGLKLGWIILIGAVGLFMLFFCICCCKNSSKPYGSPNTQNTEPAGLRDNPFRNVEADGHATTIVNSYQTEGPPAEASDDPWKPPEYDSVVKLDQFFYGDSKLCNVSVSKETGPDNKEELDDPPPYPGV